MEHSIILLNLAIALAVGLAMSRLVKLVGLPAVTGYLISGIIIGPYCLGKIGFAGIGFNSNENVTAYNIICEVALGFIAFTIGNEFRMSELKKIGKQAVVVSLFEALVAVIVVDAVLISTHFIVGEEAFPLSAAITLGAIAAATAPAATLMVVRQYKANGPLTKLLLPVVALDDAIGLIAFALSFGIARSFNGTVNVLSLIVEPLLEIVLSLAGGAVLGLLFSWSEKFFNSRSKRLAVSVTFVFLTIALSMLEFKIGEINIGFSSLLACMMLGTVFCNTCDFSEELMDRVDRWTAPLFILFFVLSGAALELDVFFDITTLIVGLLYIVFRCVGKYLGAYFGSTVMKCEPQVRHHLGITLFPQAGVALGMSLTAVQSFPTTEGHLIRNIVLFGVLIYELVGPMLTKLSLQKAGEIKLESKTSARTKNTNA